MKINNKIGKSFVVLGTAVAVSYTMSNSVSAVGIVDFKGIDNTELGKAIKNFIDKLDPKEFASTTKSFSKISESAGTIAGGLKWSVAFITVLLGINVVKDFYSAYSNFYAFVSNSSRKKKKIIPYSYLLREIYGIAKGAYLKDKVASRLVSFFRSQFGKFELLEKSKDINFSGNMVLALSGNCAAGVRLWAKIRDLFFNSGLKVSLERVSSFDVTPRGFLEKVNESVKRNEPGLLILVYDGDLTGNLIDNNTENEELIKSVSSHLVKLSKYNSTDVHSMLNIAIQNLCSSIFLGRNVIVDVSPVLLKRFTKKLLGEASNNPNLIYDTASGIVTSVERYISKKKLCDNLFKSLRMKVDVVEGSEGVELSISHTTEINPAKVISDTFNRV